jgi:predicted XRE-type DNA-binding protein
VLNPYEAELLDLLYKILYNRLGNNNKTIKIMALKFYESPFHATETPEMASKSVLKADLTIMIRDIIEQQGWTQKEAAEILGVTQPRISDIINGKIDKFTLDVLFSLLDKLGFRAEFTFGNLEEASIKIQKASTLV